MFVLGIVHMSIPNIFFSAVSEILWEMFLGVRKRIFDTPKVLFGISLVNVVQF